MEKSKRGRKSKFDGIDLEQVRKLANRGWTDAEMAEFFKVTEQTWNNWKIAHNEFFEALKDWKAEADNRVERALYERALGYNHKHQEIMLHQKSGQPVVVDTIKHYPPDTTACIFWMKNRQPERWREKQELSIPEGLDIRTINIIPASQKPDETANNG